MSFVRFETHYSCEHSGQPLGVFRAASRVDLRIPQWTSEWLQGSLDWFNANLPVPQVDDPRGIAIFWFRPHSPVIREMWKLVTILRAEDVPIRLRFTRIPGQIVYRDDYQIAAIPYGHGRRRRSRPHLPFDRHRWV